jgi:hypothetical protein
MNFRNSVVKKVMPNSVFVFSLRAAFDCVFNFKTLKVHNMFRSLRPSSGVKLWIEEVAVLAFLRLKTKTVSYCVRQDAKKNITLCLIVNRNFKVL